MVDRNQTTLIHDRVALAERGENPTVIARMRSGFLVLADNQAICGWCILLPSPVVFDLNTLDDHARRLFLADMALAGDALLKVTGAYRMNYSILGNVDQAL
ncbi:MAG TPA: hypothetical protein PK402_07440, partial [Tepidisphaeraceae bacterium]|nr:hypothetical protein [Tepidisphaeraceae bacterium]